MIHQPNKDRTTTPPGINLKTGATELIDKCIFIRCPKKKECYRFGKKMRSGQKIRFSWWHGCAHFWDIKYKPVKQVL